MSTKNVSAHTKAFGRLRDETQAVLDFSVLVCNAIPLLKMTIKNLEKGKESTNLAKPDYFKAQPNRDKLKCHAQEYKKNLSKYILLSNFSFFEAYVNDAIDEIFEFHGGVQQMLDAAKTRCLTHVNPEDEGIQKNRKKLQDSYDKNKHQKYIKYTNVLKRQHFKFPSELLSPYGIMKLRDEIKNLKSNSIPSILQDGLHIEFTKDEINQFHSIRVLRNKIAHGENVGIDIPKAIECNGFLRNIAVRIDNQICSNYFVIEKYA